MEMQSSAGIGGGTMLLPPKPSRRCVRLRVAGLVGAVLAIGGCAHGGTPTTSEASGRATPAPSHAMPAPVASSPNSSAGPTGGARRRMASDAPVLVVGDSLGVGTEPFLPRLLRGRQVSQQVTVSRSTSNGLALLRERAGSLPPIIVVSLGTNDGPAPAPFRALVERVLATASPRRCVVWATIVRPGRMGGYSWSALNQVLARAAARHPNLRLVQWATLVNAHPRWLAPDGVHTTVRGYRARAAAIAAAVRTCDQPA